MACEGHERVVRPNEGCGVRWRTGTLWAYGDIRWRVVRKFFHGSRVKRLFHSSKSATWKTGRLGSLRSAQLKGSATAAPARARGENGAIAVAPRSLRK